MEGSQELLCIYDFSIYRAGIFNSLAMNMERIFAYGRKVA